MEVILVIAEGAKAESLIIDNLKKVLFNKQVIIKLYLEQVYIIFIKGKRDMENFLNQLKY